MRLLNGVCPAECTNNMSVYLSVLSDFLSVAHSCLLVLTKDVKLYFFFKVHSSSQTAAHFILKSNKQEEIVKMISILKISHYSPTVTWEL